MPPTLQRFRHFLNAPYSTTFPNKLLGVQPDEMIFVDNVPSIVAAAHKIGIHAVLFQNNAQAIRDIEALLAAHA